jgi:P-type Cu+ transporter
MLEGGETMEAIRCITHVVLDKTGTLTQGRPQVSNMSINSSWQSHEAELAVLICAAEEKSLSIHPLASAIFSKLLPMCGDLWSHYHDSGDIRNRVETSGRGITCEINSGWGIWRNVSLGNLEHMKRSGIHAIETIPDHVDNQGSIVFVAIDGKLATSIILQVRPKLPTNLRGTNLVGFGST